MRVKRSILQNLSTTELQNYIKDDSRFVPEAIELAYEILKNERNIQFSTEETLRIKNLISSKISKIETDKKKSPFEPNLVEDTAENSAKPKLHSKLEIVTHSSVFFSFVGAYLLNQNSKILNKSSKVFTITLVIYVISMFVFDYYLYQFIINHQEELSHIKYKRFGNLGIFFTIRGVVNFIIVTILWNIFFGKDLEYREQKSSSKF